MIVAAQECMATTIAQVGVDHHQCTTALRQSDRQVQSSHGLPFTRVGAGEQNDLWRFLCVRKQQHGADGAVGLGDDRERVMRNYKLLSEGVTCGSPGMR